VRRLRITTPELVPLEFRIAGTPERGIAWLLDECLILVATALMYLLAMLFGAITVGLGLLPAIGLVTVGRFVVNLGYRWWAETRWRGQTWGKRIMSLRTVQLNGTPPLAWQAFVRNAVRPIDALPLFSLLGAIMIVFDPEGRRTGDFLAGTVVIREVRHALPRAARLLANEQNSLMQDGAASGRIRNRLKARDAAVLAEFVVAAQRIETARRLRIAERLATHYRDVLGLGAHRALPDEALLRGIVGVAFRDRFGTPVSGGSRPGHASG
jgi:uncharacterized RDD family membrane protein YckC